MADYNLGTARGKIEIDAGGVNSSLAAASASTNTFKKNSEAASASLIGTGKVVGGFGIAIAAGLGFAVKTAADFEKRISAVGAVSGATEGQLEKIRAKALQLGADTAFSAGESAQAMEELVKAGLTVDDVLNGAADATVNLAAAGEVDLPRAAEIAANSMNQFNLDAQQMPKVADLIAGAANASAISVEDFGMSLSQVGAVANLAGLSFDDTATAIAAMGNAGIKGSDAGTSLKTMLGNLQPTTEKAAGAMQDLGVITEDGTNKFYDQEGRVKSLAEISEILHDGTKDMSAAQKQMALETAFGSDAIRAAAVFANEGAAGINNMNDAMSKVTAAEVAAKRMDNLSGSIEQLKGSLETMMINLGSALQAPVRKLVDTLTSLVNKFTELGPNAQKNIVLIAAGAAALLTAAGSFLAVAGYIMKLTTVFNALKVALLANPWVLVIAGLIAVGVALFAAYQKFEGFRKVIDTMFDGVQALFGPLITSISSFIENLVKQVQNLIDVFKSGDDVGSGFAEIMDNIFGNSGRLIPMFTTLYNAVSKTFNWIKSNVVPIVDRVVQALGGWGNVLKGIGIAIAFVVAPFFTLVAAFVYAYQKFEWFRKGVDFVVNAILAYFSFMVNAVRTYIQAWIDAIRWVVDFVKGVPDAFDSMTKSVITFIQPLTTWLQQNLFPVFTAFGALVESVVTFVIAAWKRIWPAVEFVGMLIGGLIGGVLLVAFNLLKVALNLLVAAFQIAWEAIKAGVQIFVDIVTAAWRAFGDNLIAAVVAAWNFIKGTIEAALKIIRGIFQTITALLKGDWGKAWDGIKTILGGAVDFIKTLISFMWATIKNLFNLGVSALRFLWDSAWSIIKNVLKAAWEGIKIAVSAGIDAVVGFMRALPGRVLSAVGNLASTLLGKGKELLAGMLEGARRGWDSLYNFLTTIPGKILGAIGNLGSTLLQAGKDAIGGLIQGMKDMIPDVGSVLGGITDMIPIKKGPPARDKVLLEENGRLIMAGLINGMRSMIPTLEANLGGMTATIPGMVSMPRGSGGGQVINLNFNGTFGAGAEDAIRETINDPTLLGQIITAAKAGAGGN